jgi:AmmeMemoRadiSam system protein B
MIRKPAVAGQFYPGSEKALLSTINSMIDVKAKKESAIGVVSPHAGYVYSGPVAGQVLSAIKPRSTYIIMGPNHTGMGEAFSMATSDSWKTPLGEVKVNAALARSIADGSAYIKGDDDAHAAEHSVEVQLPFLQALQKDFTFVPLVISCADVETYRSIGKELARAIRDCKLEKDITIIASSDMTHYEPHEAAKLKDAMAIDAILALDEKKLVETVERMSITMCGYAPTAIMLVAAKELGATSARLVKYQTSGDASGDYSSVVGYAGIVIT